MVECYLQAGEAMMTGSGSMSWMTPNMKMETTSGGGLKKMFGRMFSGESVFQNRYIAQNGEGMIAFASSSNIGVLLFAVGFTLMMALDVALG